MLNNSLFEKDTPEPPLKTRLKNELLTHYRTIVGCSRSVASPRPMQDVKLTIGELDSVLRAVEHVEARDITSFKSSSQRKAGNNTTTPTSSPTRLPRFKNLQPAGIQDNDMLLMPGIFTTTLDSNKEYNTRRVTEKGKSAERTTNHHLQKNLYMLRSEPFKNFAEKMIARKERERERARQFLNGDNNVAMSPTTATTPSKMSPRNSPRAQTRSPLRHPSPNKGIPHHVNERTQVLEMPGNVFSLYGGSLPVRERDHSMVKRKQMLEPLLPFEPSEPGRGIYTKEGRRSRTPVKTRMKITFGGKYAIQQTRDEYLDHRHIARACLLYTSPSPRDQA
eukprot:TRINITY_DN8145_c0_g1_i1.p1 TRINITY_DN8145_c0_g1~~TRINITY_DN8145_c0_g1_i1.p1  ORF type:complete len:335 (-),score=47.04 TRINITY_DN8145_c0_g1_i1:34-1038(-)